MKRLFFCLMAMFAITACTDDGGVDNSGGGDNGGDSPSPSITLSASSLSVASDNSEATISFTSTTAWSAEVTEGSDWCTINPTSGAAGSAKITVTTVANESYEDRSATVVIKAGDVEKSVTIKQMQKGAIIVADSEYKFDHTGGELDFEIQTNVDFTVTISDNATEWIQQVETRAWETKTLHFNIASNSLEEDREGTITISGDGVTQTVKIKQMQKGAIIVADSEYEFDHTGGELDFEIQTNVDFTVTISDNATEWIQQVDTRALETKTLHFNISANSSEDDREGTITISGDGVTQTVKIKQIGIADLLEVNRAALIALYNATNGGNWINNDNWCSDKPISEWYGIGRSDSGFRLILPGNNLSGSLPDEIGNLTLFQELALNDNNITGSIPESIGELKDLSFIWLSFNRLTGSIPESIGRLTNLSYFNLSDNQLSGSIPESIGNCDNIEIFTLSTNQLTGEIPKSIGNLKKLRSLSLDYNQLSGQIPAELGCLENLVFLGLNDNMLTGSIPESLGNLKKLEPCLLLYNNGLSGRVPESIMQAPYWSSHWYWVISQNPQKGGGISRESVKIQAPKFLATDIYGNTIDDSVYKNNKYTAICYFDDSCPTTVAFMPTMVKLYNQYKEKGFGVIAFGSGTKEELIAENQLYGATWPCFDRDMISTSNGETFFETFNSYVASNPMVNVVNSEGYLEFIYPFDSFQNIGSFLLDKLGEPDDVEDITPDYYTSTDYSKDGEVKRLQTATKGNGIDIVLMGDAFSDRLIADGTYDSTMRTAMEQFFAVEPYKSFRDHFNVYSVTAVSQNENYSDITSTVFEGYFGEGTHVGGNDETVFEYAAKAISADRIDDALVVVMMNSRAYAGTCYMYYPTEGDWGDGASVSYFPVGDDEEALGQVLHHEAGGHGFSKLGDEYAYQENGTISGSEIADAQNMATYGWWKNVDFTNDPTAVKWSHFLSDARYASEGLGVYEGAYTYWTGAYRPTYNSIMNTNVGGFNAPSREAIYYRIHKLAYGSSWAYDYEEFVEWDAKNRVTSSAAYGIPYRLNVPKNFKPLHPPVVVNKSWREVMNK